MDQGKNYMLDEKFLVHKYDLNIIKYTAFKASTSLAFDNFFLI